MPLSKARPPSVDFVVRVQSGAAAIVYEVAWQRLLVLPSGIGTWSVTIVVAAVHHAVDALAHVARGEIESTVRPLRKNRS